LRAQPARIARQTHARVSTKDGRQDTENQLIALRDYCAKQGWTITGDRMNNRDSFVGLRPEVQTVFSDASVASSKALIVLQRR
jgi:DNA invertase Pin-like site-specific DNA recombinase